MDYAKIFRTLIAGLASVTTFVFGKPDVWLMSLLVMVITDYISGLAAAYINNELSSKVGFNGILKKVMYFFVVAVAHCIDVATGAGGVLQNLTIGFLIANEGISVLENCAKCGIPIPKRLLNALAQIKGAEENDKKNNTERDNSEPTTNQLSTNSEPTSDDDSDDEDGKME